MCVAMTWLLYDTYLDELQGRNLVTGTLVLISKFESHPAFVRLSKLAIGQCRLPLLCGVRSIEHA
jgi:hypothetical protein